MALHSVVSCDQCGAVLHDNRDEGAPGAYLFLSDEGPCSDGHHVEQFCNWRCLADYATARALIESAEPP